MTDDPFVALGGQEADVATGNSRPEDAPRIGAMGRSRNPFEKKIDPIDSVTGSAKKKKKAVDLNPMSERLWESRGYTTCRVDRWDARSFHFNDLWGFADRIAFKMREGGGVRLVFIQTTSWGNVNARIRKLTQLDDDPRQAKRPEHIVERVRECLGQGCLVVVEGWLQEGDKGSRWRCDETQITLDMLLTESPRERRSKKEALGRIAGESGQAAMHL